jgi:prophage antirepressor-like protein
MTEALATPFEGKEIRTFEQNGEPWFPLVDLARAWGISRSTLPDIIARNPDLFEGCYALVGVTPSTPDSTTDLFSCVNERGLYLVMGRITSSRLKNSDAAAAILRFQRWVPELIQRYRKKEIAATCQKAPEAFEAEVLRKHGKEYLIPALQVPATPALVHGEPGTWFTATQLAEMCGIDRAEYVNNYLHNHGWIYRDASEGRVWRLQPMAMEHGREYWFEAPSGHREIRIVWRMSILYAAGLRREIPKDQMALPARVNWAAASGSGA